MLAPVIRYIRHASRHPSAIRGWLWRGAVLLLAAGPGAVLRHVRRHRCPESQQRDPAYLEWLRHHEHVAVPDRNPEAQAGPRFSLVLDAQGVSPAKLLDTLGSVLGQGYTRWELLVVRGGSGWLTGVSGTLRRTCLIEPRVRLIPDRQAGDVAQAFNGALALAAGDFVMRLSAGDRLGEGALAMVAAEIVRTPHLGLIYSDEDRLRGNCRYGHHFKPDLNPDLLLASDYIGRLAAYQRSLLEELGGLRSGLSGAEDYDLALRAVARLAPQQVDHLPYLLYHRGERADPPVGAALSAVADVLAASGVRAQVTESDLLPGKVRVRYPVPAPPPMVSIIVPTHNRADLLRRCVESLYARTSYPSFELLVVDNGSDEATTLAYLAELSEQGLARVILYSKPFNYSKINNCAAAQARGEILAFLNNDVEVITPGWLDEMVSHAVRPGIGAVGARLWYPDGRLQHGGVVLGLYHFAGHAFKGIRAGDPGYQNRAMLVQNWSAVTAACLVLRRELFERVGGFEEEHLAVALNDVDLCLRIRELGFRNLWTPFAELYHHEHASRGRDDTAKKAARFEREIAFLRGRWETLIEQDPAYNPNLARDREDFALRS